MYLKKGFRSKKKLMKDLENIATIFYDGSNAKATVKLRVRELHYTVRYENNKPIFE